MSKYFSGFSFYLGEDTKQKTLSFTKNEEVANEIMYNYHIRERWLTLVRDLIVHEVGKFDQNDNFGSI